MEYGRLVVLGYSSYHVATVRNPRSEIPQSQSFGLSDAAAVAAATEALAASADGHAGTNGDTGADPMVARQPPGSVTRNGSNVAATTLHSPASGRTGASSSSSTSSSSSSGSHSLSSKKSLGQLWEPIGDQNAQYILQKRKRANGVSLSHFHHFCQKKELSSSSSSSSSAAAVAAAAKSKDIKAMTKRMMQAVDAKRAGAADLNSSNNVDTADSPSDGTNTANVDPGSRTAPSSPYLMCVPMNDKDAHASLTEYKADTSSDMFQIGRMPCRQNDFVIPGPRVGASGTISRFAARILCTRAPPYQCRIYAGGFDVTRKMTTAGHALKFCTGCSSWLKKLPLDHSCVLSHLEHDERSSTAHRQNARGVRERENNQSSHSATRDVVTTLEDMDHMEMEVNDPSDVPIDGVTKNGVRVWLPEHKQWFEVSVNGNLYAIESRTAASAVPLTSSSRSASSASRNPVSSSVRHSAFNRPIAGSDGVPPILTDGAIIDLGGVQLQFQTSHKPVPTAGERASLFGSRELVYGRPTDSSVVDQLERLNIQCPVQLHSLRFTRPEPGEEVDSIQIPHVFPACGHVFGFEPRIANSKTCPLCRHPGNLVKLLLKQNSQLQSAADHHTIPECVLNPCGHAISSKLASHYSSLLMPNGRAICPFCAVHLDPRIPYSRLYLYSETEE